MNKLKVILAANHGDFVPNKEYQFLSDVLPIV
jgi:hypothetical protein